MVDALRETWRVLAADGTLLDLRPLSSRCDIEVVTSAHAVPLGEVDATGYLADDMAADRAAHQVVEAGWFVPCRETFFGVEFYWDTVAEMKSFMEQSKRMGEVRPSYADLDKAFRELSEAASGGGRLRCRRPTMLAAYRKAASDDGDPDA